MATNIENRILFNVSTESSSETNKIQQWHSEVKTRFEDMHAVLQNKSHYSQMGLKKTIFVFVW